MPTSSLFASGWRSPAILIYVLTVAMAVATGTGQALMNNFAVERISFTGAEIGLLHTFREIPGLLAFTVVFVLLIIREQRLACGFLVPRHPAPGNEWNLLPRRVPATPAE
jgi:hypothetical protein